MAKLTKRQWNKIKERLDNGEKATSLASEYGISRQAITNKFSLQKKAVLTAANQIVASNEDMQKSLQKLAPDLQLKAWDLAGELMAISKHLSSGAKYGAMTFHKISGIANIKAQNLDEENPSTEDLQIVAALIKVGNDAAAPSLNLLNANKATIEKMATNEDNSQPLTLNDFYRVNA